MPRVKGSGGIGSSRGSKGAEKTKDKTKPEHICLIDGSFHQSQNTAKKRYMELVRKYTHNYVLDEDLYKFVIDGILFTHDDTPVFIYYKSITSLNYDKIYSITVEKNDTLKIKIYAHAISEKCRNRWNQLKLNFIKECVAGDAIDRTTEIVRKYRRIIK